MSKYEVQFPDPKIYSYRSVGFYNDQGNIILKAEYWIRTTNLEEEVVDGHTIRTHRPATFSKHTIDIPLVNLEDGEDLFNIHLDLLEALKKIVESTHNRPDDSANLKEKLIGETPATS